MSQTITAITETDKLFLHELMNKLASVCDHALTEDGQGFNAPHSSLGHQLAAMPANTWDLECCNYAYSLAIFYQAQLEGFGYPVEEIKALATSYTQLDIAGGASKIKAKIAPAPSTYSALALVKPTPSLAPRLIKGFYDRDNKELCSFAISWDKKDAQFNTIYGLVKQARARWDNDQSCWHIKADQHSGLLVATLEDSYGFELSPVAESLMRAIEDKELVSYAGKILPWDNFKSLVIRFDYDPDNVAKVKAIHNDNGLRCKWDGMNKNWSADIKLLRQVVATFPNFYLEPSLVDLLEDQKKAFENKTSSLELSPAEIAACEAEKAVVRARLGITLADGRTPRDYQLEGAIFLLEQGKAILAYDVGLGKTLTALLAAKECNLPIIVVCPASVRTNWAREAASLGIHLYSETIVDDRQGIETTIGLATYSWNKFPDMDGLPPKFTAILDECFPYDTLVQTDKGLLKIGDIVTQTLDVKLLSCNLLTNGLEYKPIARYIQTGVKPLYKINIGSKELICTANHKIYIEGKGYVQAKNITRGQTVRVMRQSHTDQQSGQMGLLASQVLQQGMCAQTQEQFTPHPSNQQAKYTKSYSSKTRQAVALSFCQDESKQSYEQPGKQSKDASHSKKDRTQAYSAGGQRQAYAQSTVSTVPSLAMVYRIRGQHGNHISFNPRFIPLLQDRYSQPRKENSDRGRWGKPSTTRETSTRQEKRPSFELARVDSVEIYQQSNLGRSGQDSFRDQHVYNLEVVDNHNYFANDVLVSNCHKSAAGNKTGFGKNALTLGSKATNCYMLTGTPLPNGRPRETFTMLKIAGHSITNNKSYYEKRYCAAKETRWGWDNSGASNLDEWSRLVKSKLLVKKKEDCLSLPPLMRALITIDGDDDDKKLYNSAVQALVKAYKEKILLGTIQPADALVLMGIVRRCSSMIKAKYAIEKCQEILDSNPNDKVLIFTDFIESVTTLTKAFSCDAIQGSVPTADRQGMVDKLFNTPARVLVTTRAGGEGLNIQATNHIIFVDRTFVPKDYVQVEGRAHRSGQAKTVFSYWLQYNDSDKHIDNVIVAKQKRIDLALEGERKTMRGIDSAGDIALEILHSLMKGLGVE